ncbi:MAG: histidine phosphatase family protein [Fibrobacteres bacterium]|nr:histidine phosphatase family protein [Fibrobacterota bacterium]
MNTKTNIYLLRHSESEKGTFENNERPLSKHGIKYAEAIAPFILGLNCSYVYSSPFKRAIDTIKPYCELAKCSFQIEESFREGTEQETKEILARKINPFLLRITNEHSGKNILICTHGGVIFSLISSYLPTFSYENYKLLTSPDIKCIVFHGNVGKYDEDFHFDLKTIETTN